MKANVGSYDAGVRFLIGCVVLFFTVNGLGWWGLLGLVPILSAFSEFCCVYWVFGLNTTAWGAKHDMHMRSWSMTEKSPND